MDSQHALFLYTWTTSYDAFISLKLKKKCGVLHAPRQTGLLQTLPRRVWSLRCRRRWVSAQPWTEHCNTRIHSKCSFLYWNYSISVFDLVSPPSENGPRGNNQHVSLIDEKSLSEQRFHWSVSHILKPLKLHTGAARWHWGKTKTRRTSQGQDQCQTSRTVPHFLIK